MLALQGASDNRMTRLPWSIWLAMLKSEATKLKKKKERRPNSHGMNHSTSITPARGRSDRGGRHGRMAEEAKVDEDADQAMQAATESQPRLHLG
jgi:hypothetical protein